MIEGAEVEGGIVGQRPRYRQVAAAFIDAGVEIQRPAVGQIAGGQAEQSVVGCSSTRQLW